MGLSLIHIFRCVVWLQYALLISEYLLVDSTVALTQAMNYYGKICKSRTYPLSSFLQILCLPAVERERWGIKVLQFFHHLSGFLQEAATW